MQAEPLIKDKNTSIMVLCGDTPLVTGATLKKFYEEHVQSGAKASVLTTFMPDPFGYGRVIRLVDGSVEKNRRTKKMLANVNLQSMKSIQEFIVLMPKLYLLA